MEKYNYYEEVKNDVINYINEYAEELKAKEYDADEMYEYLNDELFDNDSVTGNASGSYFFSTWKAEEAICHNWDLIAECLDNDYITDKQLKEGAETIDVCVRCYVLGQVLAEAIEETEICEELEEVED